MIVFTFLGELYL